MIDTQDVYEAPMDVYSEGEHNKANYTLQHNESTMHGDIFSLTSWNNTAPMDGQNGKIDNTIASWDSLRTRGDGSSSSDAEKELSCTGFEGADHSEVSGSPSGHSHSLPYTKNGAQHQNGCGSPAAAKTVVRNTEFQHCYFQYDTHQETLRNFDASAVLESPPGGPECRFETTERERCEACEPTAEPNPEGVKELSQPGNSELEVIRKIPLKPQRSKKSLNRGNAQTQAKSVLDAASDLGPFGETLVWRSAEDSYESPKGGGDDVAAVHRGPEVVKPARQVGKRHNNAAMTGHQEPHHYPTPYAKAVALPQQAQGRDRDEVMGSTGQYTSSTQGMWSQEAEMNLFGSASVSAAQTTPPRSLPLKSLWSRDGGGRSRPNSMEGSHILGHIHRNPGQDATKRKQAVKHPPPDS